MSAALVLFWALWAMIARTVVFVPDVSLGAAYMDCVNGRSIVHIARDANVGSYNHELVHVIDCVDDGRVNGSFGPQSDPYITLPYCLQYFELPACVAQFTPQIFIDWMK